MSTDGSPRQHAPADAAPAETSSSQPTSSQSTPSPPASSQHPTSQSTPSHPAPSDAAGSETPHWQEHPIGLGGGLADGVARTLTPFLVGLAAAFLLCLAVGLLAEEQRLPAAVLNQALDQLARYSLLPVMVLAWTAGLISCLALGVRDVAVSRAVHRAVTDGAPRTAVPHPAQVERVTIPPGAAYTFWTYAHVGVLGLLVVMLFGYLLFEDFPEGWLLLLGLVAVLGLFVAGLVLLRRRIGPRHEARRQTIAQHWTTGHEQAAWSRGRKRQEAPVAADGSRRRIRLGAGLTHLATIVLVVAMLLLNGLLFLTHPQAQRYPGGQAGPRADLSADAERVVGLGLWTFGLLVAGGLLCALIGTVVEARAHAAEKAVLRRALQDPEADPPPADLLQRYAAQHTPRLAQACAAVGAASLSVGLAGAGLGTLQVEEIGGVYRGAREVFADLVPSFLAVAAAGSGLVLAAFVLNAVAGAGGRELRNALHARWPVVPAAKRDGDSPPPRARLGPALSIPPRKAKRARPRT